MGISLPGRVGLDPDELEDVNRELMDKAGYTGRGAYVERVNKNSPAENAGLRDGDIITQINSKAVPGLPPLRQLISINRPGDNIPVRIRRNGEQKDLVVTLADLASNDAARETNARAFANFGVLRADETDAGLVLRELDPDSAAYASGLRSGMTITRVGT